MEEGKRAFKGVWIPAEIWLDEELNITEKCFLVEIDSLDNDDGCFASNSYFSKFFNLSKSRCSEIIKKLETKGYIRISYQYKDEGKEIEKRIIKVNKKVFEKPNRGVFEKPEGVFEKPKDNNTFNNTLNIYISSMEKIFEYWNSKKIIVHKQITDKLKKVMLKVIKEYGEDTILKAIENYSTMLQDESCFYSYKFSLENFLKQSNGLPHFVDEEGEKWVNYQSSLKANKGAYKKNGNLGSQQFKKEDESPQMGASEFYGLSTEDTFKLLSDMMKGEK